LAGPENTRYNQRYVDKRVRKVGFIWPNLLFSCRDTIETRRKWLGIALPASNQSSEAVVGLRGA